MAHLAIGKQLLTRLKEAWGLTAPIQKMVIEIDCLSVVKVYVVGLGTKTLADAILEEIDGAKVDIVHVVDAKVSDTGEVIVRG